MNLSPVSKKWILILLHTGFWLLLFVLPYLLRQSYQDKSHTHFFAENRFEIHNGISFLTWISLFYLNIFFLLPRYYFKKAYSRYFLALGTVLLLLSFINWSTFQLLLPDVQFRIPLFITVYLFPCLFFVAISTAYAMFQDRVQTDELAKERKTENLKTELSLLRSQVSPHFMFNVLNNMVALARKGSDQLEPSLLKLSSLLRYMLYETTDKVPLQKEIEYLQSYIDLQKQRFGKSVHIHTCLQQVDDAYQIEPMLLIPFVENAFKHGTGLIEQARIDVELKAEKGILTFSVRNRFNPDSTEIKDTASGIGLANVQRRLTLLYGQNHSLLITRQDHWFIVSLQIALH